MPCPQTAALWFWKRSRANPAERWRARVACLCLAASWLVVTARADWQVLPPTDRRQPRPPTETAGGKPIEPGDSLPNPDKFHWLIGDLAIPEVIGKETSAGKAVGLRINVSDGGEVWLDGALQARFDNDHPALALVSERATPGAGVRLAVQVYGKVQGGEKFEEANWVVIDAPRASGRATLTVDASADLGSVPNGLIGLSQGGGMADYEDATAKKLKAGGFRWFRMDNVFTSVLKQSTNGTFSYEWTDWDRRLDFLRKIGAEAIMAVSYMPQVLDAVPNNDRQSAPRDYTAWEELCFQAAKRALDRDRRVAFWEVWNEVNTGWLKPGPEDTGNESFTELYSQALGKEAADHEVVRRFEAYCKLYRATARGVLRADPQSRVGGPALASGPMEHAECGHCFNGKGFARGLMLWCQQEKLPLDFLSWHEYFQSPDTIAKQAQTFRAYLDDFPTLKPRVTSLMLTEWNEAWWADRPQDHEIGAAWCANAVTRAFLPARIDRPCFFYAKQGDDNFRGDYSLLLKDNTPKAAYNMAKVFNSLSGRWLPVTGGDGELSAIAAWDATRRRLALVLVNFQDRYALRRHVRLEVKNLPTALRGGAWMEWTIDATHSNAWHDRAKAELAKTGSGETGEAQPSLDRTVAPNSITFIEWVKK